MSTDLTAIAVSVVGLVGVAATQGFAARGRRLELDARQKELEEQRQAESVQRDVAGNAQWLAERRELYAQLNSAVRAYRSACDDWAKSLLPDGDKLVAHYSEHIVKRAEDARLQYRDLYARAQMVLEDDTLAVVSEVNVCLRVGYSALRKWTDVLLSNPDAARSAGSVASLRAADVWVADSCADAIHLLRRALRAELGVAGGSRNLSADVAKLTAIRAEAQARGLRP